MRILSPLLLATLVACSPQAPTPAQAPNSKQSAPSVTGFGVSVLDLEREREFFSSLAFIASAESAVQGPAFASLVGLPGARARQLSMALGDQHLFLSQFLQPPGRPVAVGHANDFGFEHLAIVVRSMSEAYAHLQRTPMVAVSSEPQTIPTSNKVAAGVRADYFRDPEGHFLELLEFPPDKGDAAWHKGSKELFLGIDHSAIACRDTAWSLHFYRDVLGLRLMSQSLNEGIEQERLSGVAGARVQITSLRGEHGPGIELLEYLAPLGGAAFPAANAADSVHWEISIEVDRVASALAALRAASFSGVPEQPVDLSALSSQVKHAVLIKDPDGHTVRLFDSAR